MNSFLQINYFPTIYMICQDRTIREAGQINAASMYSFHNQCAQPVGNNNGAIVDYKGYDDHVCEDLGLTVSFYAIGDTRPFFQFPLKQRNASGRLTPEEMLTYDTMRVKYLTEWKPKTVILAPRWSYVSGVKETEDLIEFLGEIGCKVILIEQPPMLGFGKKSVPQYLAYLGFQPIAEQNQYVSITKDPAYFTGIQLVHELAEKYDHCELLETKDLYSKDNQVWILQGPNILYVDEDHLSDYGVSKLEPALKERLQAHFTSSVDTD